MSLDLFPDQPMINAQRFDLRPLRVSDTGQIALHSADLRIARMTSRIAHCSSVATRCDCGVYRAGHGDNAGRGYLGD